MRTVANAVSSLVASPPAPWARSGLPPPRAPSAGANSFFTQVARRQPCRACRVVGRDDERRSPGLLRRREHDHRRVGRAQPAADVEGERAQVVAAHAGRRRGEDELHAVRPPPPGAASEPALDEHLRDAQLVQLALGALEPVEHAADAVGQLVRLRLELARERLDEDVLARQVAERVEPDQRLDAAHAGTDGRLGQQLDHADHRAARDVRAAAQLARVVADLDDAHLLAVLLAEHRDRAEPLRLVLVR